MNEPTWTRTPPSKPGRSWLFAVAVLAALLAVEGLPGADADEKKPGRAPKGWKMFDAAPGYRGWAKKVKDPRTGVVFVLIEPGEFTIGSESKEAFDIEKPAHKVRITKLFYLAESETTLRQWHTFLRAAKLKERPGMTALPSVPRSRGCERWGDDAGREKPAITDMHASRTPSLDTRRSSAGAFGLGIRPGKLSRPEWRATF